MHCPLSQVRRRFPRYNLFAYGEGSHSLTMRQGQFSGHPVLFLPGNAGSYRQVRSAASICHQMFQQSARLYRFDFFTIDFDEERAGLFGQLLQDQVLFAAQAISRIQELYSNNKSCILIGHSIGGVVARALLLDPGFTPACISMILTLSAPVKEPVVRFDDSMSDFYSDSNKKWMEERGKSESKISHIIHVSIAGGFSDVLVRSQLTHLPEQDNSIDISMMTTSIPDVWITMDHLCITWCKQFMIKLSRMIYDVTDAGPHADIQVKRQIIEYHLCSRTRGKSYPGHVVPRTIVFPSTGSWISFTQRVERYKSTGKILSPVYIVIKLVPKTSVLIWLSGEHRHDWIAACTGFHDPVSNVTRCDEGSNLSANTSLLPGNMDEAATTIFKATADSLQSSHLIVSLTPQIESGVRPVSIIAERYGDDGRNIRVLLPPVIQSLTMLWSHIQILDVPVSKESCFYNLTMIGVNQAWHAYNLVIRTGSCYQRADNSRPSIAQFHVPWSREDSFHRISNSKNSVTEFVIKLNVPRSAGDHRNTSLYLFLDPDCSFQISLKFSFKEMMGQIVRFYYQYLINFIAGIIACSAGLQVLLSSSKSTIDSVDDGDDDDEPQRLARVFTGASSDQLVQHHESLERMLRRRFFAVLMYGLLPTAPFLAVSLCDLFSPESRQSSPLKYIMYLHQDDLDATQFILLFCTLSLFAYGLVYVAVLVTVLLLNLVSMFVSKVHRESVPAISAQSSSSRISVIPFILAILLSLITVSTTSAFGFLLTFLSQSVYTLVSHIKGSSVTRRRGLTIRGTVHRVHLTIAFLILLANMASFPLLLFWISRSCQLFLFFPRDQLPGMHDPHMIPCIIMIACCSFLWQGNRIAATGGKSFTLMILIRMIGLLMTTCCHNLFLLPHAVTAVILCITINCLPVFAHDQNFHHHED